MRNLRYVLSALLLICVAACEASGPVSVASRGCVIGGELYAIHDENTVYRYELSRPMNLRPYEGKLVWLDGSLLPGDRFTPRSRRFRVVGRVSPRVRAQVSRYRSIWDIAPDEVRWR